MPGYEPVLSVIVREVITEGKDLCCHGNTLGVPATRYREHHDVGVGEEGGDEVERNHLPPPEGEGVSIWLSRRTKGTQS